MARLADRLGHRSLASDWRQRASDLKVRFDAMFWSPSLSSFALALDGEHRRCEILTSNAGHCLYTGIAQKGRMEPLVKQLMGGRMFSGWGLRTLAEGEKRYNPISYHNGSVWPHDNAIVAEGLAMSGWRAEASRILGGLFAMSTFMELSRLPELFCGFQRQQGVGPTRYPVACAPQAWAAGSVFSLLRATLGLKVHGAARRVSFSSPLLPSFLREARIFRLPAGGGSVDLRLVRQRDEVALTVMRAEPEVEVIVVK
jgi:glycogen debranching enzyme